jgi:Polyketide cyclase / dehydrase and lipid transport
LEYARVEHEIAAPIQSVWAVARRFGAIREWVDGVSACTVTGSAPNVIRTVTRNGKQVRERLILLDEQAFHLSYELLEPHGLAARDICSSISLEALGDTRCRVTWRSEATFDSSPEQLRTYIEQFYRTSLERLAQLVAADVR